MAGATCKRASRATGVGRGNSEGSKTGQFQPGEPSRNPQGRPPKVKHAVNPDLRDMMLKMLSEEVAVRENGVSRRMPQQQAMVKMMLNGFRDASHRDRLELFKFIWPLFASSSTVGEGRNGDIPHQAVAEFLEGLAQAHERLEREGLA